MAIALDKLSPADLDRYINTQSIIDRQGNEAAKVRAMREYYAGEFPVMLTQRQQEFLGDLVADDTFTFAHNLFRSVIDTLAERLSVEGFAVNGAGVEPNDGAQAGADNGLAALLWEWWKGNGSDITEQDVYLAALRDGTAYVMVDFDAATGAPRFTVHEQDDGESGVRLVRDPGDRRRVLYATRYFWEVDADGKRTERRTVYLPDQIRKYKRGAGGWEKVEDADDIGWPLPWRSTTGQPLGVAVVEFANPGGAECAQIVGLQNLLNKAWLDLVAAADASGFPLLVAEYSDGAPLGGQSDDDLEGADEFRIAPGRMIEISGGTLRRIEAANLLPMLEVIWATVAAIAGVSRTPQYYLRPQGGADVPSGESLKQLESGLVARARKRQRIFGQAWEDVLHLALRVQATFGGGIASGDVPRLEVQWADAETRNEAVQAQVAEAHKRLDVPLPAVWAQLGYTPEQIAEFEMIQRRQRAQDVATIAATLRTQGNAGQTGQGNPAQPEQLAAAGQNGNGVMT